MNDEGELDLAVVPRETLEQEARRNPIFGAVAIISVVVTFAALILRVFALQADPGPGDQSVRSLIKVDENTDALWGATALQVAGLLTMAVVAWRLVTLVGVREVAPRAMRILAVLGPLAVVITAILGTISLIDASHTFIASGPRTKDRVDDLLHGGGPERLLGVASVGTSVLLATWVGWTSLAAARVGLLTRFLGYFGAGAAVAFPIVGLPGQGLMVGWLASVGLLMLGWWPGGRGPSWTTGEIGPWEVASATRRQERLSP
jgi:hypothetical protein